MSQLRFDNRVAVVTGGARGLGRAYALLLASRGARVVVNDTGASKEGTGLDAGPAEELAERIRDEGGDAIACLESVATPKGGAAIVEAALERYGRIDILIHSAGNVRWASLKEMTQEDFDAVLDVHLRGAYHVVRPAFPVMCRAGYGRVVLTSSIDGVYGFERVGNYSVAKTGTIGLCNAVALEGAAEGVKCNVILPGALTRMAEGMDTSGFPSMPPALVAPAVAWLAHESCHITGEMLISIAGRIARAFVGESPGVCRESWTVEQVAESMAAIRDVSAPVVFAPVPSGHHDHIRYSLAMRRAVGRD
jgi:NAD(P)-dependent dehydrogenase (short-subunit alcohol dehydrogenase family)